MSSQVRVPVCEECGLVAVYDLRRDKHYCTVCGENAEVSEVEMSYAFKLFLDELKSLTIYPRLKLKGKY